ncbi:ATP-binding cassette domain-containing protein, partial [bacterium]|nr:ATP-binding cassette domain-containing protein [bacterium]
SNYIHLEKYIQHFTNVKSSFYCFELEKYIPEEKVLLLSSVSTVTGDLKELYETDISKSACAVTEYIHSNYASTGFKLNNNFMFSNLMMLINLNWWKEHNYYNKLINAEFSDEFKSEKRFYLELINYIIKDYTKLTLKYNYTENYLAQPLSCSNSTKSDYKRFLLHIEKPLIISFIGPVTEGNTPYRNSYINLWWKYAEQTEIYDDIKGFRQVNKYKLSTTSAKNSFKYTWLLSRIFPYIKPYLGRIIIGFLIAIPLGLLDGVTAFALKPYMDYVIGGKSLDFTILNHSFSIESLAMAFILPAAVIMFAVLQGVLRYLNDYISAWTSQRITNDVKIDLFHRLIHMHPQFFDDNSSGIVISRYMGDPQTASAGIVDQIKSITTNLCGAMGLIAVMIYSSYKLAFIGVLVLCMAFVPVALIRKRIKETSNKNMVIGGNITTNINETYNGNKVMAAYDLQDRQEQYFTTQIWKSFNINMSLTKRAAWMSPLMYLIASIGIAIVLGYGTYLINTGNMTAGSFASFVTSLLLLYKPVKGLGGTLTGIQNIFVAMGRVFELFDLEPAIKEAKNPIEMKGLNSGITFENVVFEYVPNQPVLKNINLNVTKNETIAVVGNSGGGKSTLVNLIPRFYDIKSGHLKIDGIDVKNISMKSLRKNISMVFQDNFLYSGTIKDNIMMGNPTATSEELMAAIKSAHLQDMIQELPEGLETELGERGLTLSGGQRQRVAIARAMLRNAPIVILDEATSALDNESEAIVQKAMDNLMQNRTVFIIAHRLSTIKNADRIAVINEGELVELGRHEDLINIENGQYKHLYEMQFKKQPSLT